MAKYETKYECPEMLKMRSTGRLIELWEQTENAAYSEELPIVRGWLMDEFDRRNPTGFNAWLDQEMPEDKDLRDYMLVNSMCLDCAKYCAGCAGTSNAVWTGCVYRVRKEA